MVIKYSEPLSKNQFLHYQYGFSGIPDSLDVQAMTKEIASSVSEVMSSNSIPVQVSFDDIKTGGMLSSKHQPGALFNFSEKKNYAGFLMGLNKVKGILEVCVVQRGAPSAAMQRINKAEAKGFSLSGLISRAMTNKDEVGEESLHYEILLQAIRETVEAYAE